MKGSRVETVESAKNIKNYFLRVGRKLQYLIAISSDKERNEKVKQGMANSRSRLTESHLANWQLIKRNLGNSLASLGFLMVGAAGFDNAT